MPSHRLQNTCHSIFTLPTCIIRANILAVDPSISQILENVTLNVYDGTGDLNSRT